MSDETRKVLHYKRQFLSPEESRNERATCYSYVYIDSDPDGIEVEAEFQLSDGWRDYVNFDGTKGTPYDPDEHLAMITTLMEQIIAYRQAYAEALAIVRGQGLTRGNGIAVVMTVNGME